MQVRAISESIRSTVSANKATEQAQQERAPGERRYRIARSEERSDDCRKSEHRKDKAENIGK